MNEKQAAGADKPAHPVVYMFLMSPFGIVSGYLTVTLSYLFSRAGIALEQIAILQAISFIPQMFKFLWAPLVDVTLSVKKWYILATVISALCIFSTSVVPIKASSLTVLIVLIILSNFVVSFVSMAVNSLAAHDTPEHVKGRASGYMQAGNMGGAGVGGGIGLFLAEKLPWIWVSGATLAVICLLCCLGLFFVKEPPIVIRVKQIPQTISNVLVDVWDTVKTKLGILGLILCLMPMGTCAASGLFSSISKDWRASVETVAMVTGIVGGLITGLGSLAGGWICDIMNRKTAYMVAGVLQGACCVGMAIFPHTQVMYIVWTLLYSITAGLAYAGYNAFTLEAIGKGAAATKFEIFASISNIPIFLMTYVAGKAYTAGGANGMFYTEAIVAVIAVSLFLVIWGAIKGSKKTAPVVTESYM